MSIARCERGQATIEWVGLVLLASLVLGSLAAVVPVVDGRSFGGFLTSRILCAVKGDCEEAGDPALARAYGKDDAALLREHAPSLVYEPGERQLPVDFRLCREVACALAPDDPDLDAHRTDAGLPATGFTRVVRRGGRTYLQYWFYYPDSNSTFAGSDRLWKGTPLRHLGGYPGYHRDDWEAYHVRLDSDGTQHVRSSSHGHYQWCKQRECRNEWGANTGWTRVSRGSHAGHQPLERDPGPRRGGRVGAPRTRPVEYRLRAPGRGLRERATTGEGIRLVALETLDHGSYRPLDKAIKPPWRKEAYGDPESNES